MRAHDQGPRRPRQGHDPARLQEGAAALHEGHGWEQSQTGS